MNGILEWAASLGTIVAAGLIAADMTRRVTGWGFVLFCSVSILWIISAILDGAIPLAVMNAVLFVINGWGVWRFLINPAREQSS